MKLVLDTNVILAALLWRGTTAKIWALALKQGCKFFISQDLLSELETVIARKKFDKYFEGLDLTREAFMKLVVDEFKLIQPAPIPPTILADPPDDAVLACAVGAEVDAMVSGNKHLLDLEQFQDIPIITVSAWLELLNAEESS
jgi:putative PIN family toxin of toxin-antitoxin system